MIKKISELLEAATDEPQVFAPKNELSCLNIKEIALKKAENSANIAPLPKLRPKRRRAGLLLAAVIAAGLLAGTAIAARLALKYEDLVETPNTSVAAETEFGDLTFTVRETMYDGIDLLYKIAVTPPSGGKTLLFSITEGNFADQLWSFYGDKRVYDGELTLAEYMAQHGYEHILVVGFGDYAVEPGGVIVLSGGFSSNSNSSYVLWDDSAPQIGDTVIAELEVHEGILGADGNQQFSNTYIPQTYEVPIKISAEYTQAELVETKITENINQAIPELGIRVDKIELTNTPYQTMGKIYWTIINAKAYYGTRYNQYQGINFTLLDADGKTLRYDYPLGFSGYSSADNASRISEFMLDDVSIFGTDNHWWNGIHESMTICVSGGEFKSKGIDGINGRTFTVKLK